MRAGLAPLALGVALAAAPSPAAARPLLTTYSLAAPDGGTVVRAIVAGPGCPTLTVDGRATPMAVRADPATLPPRPTASAPELSKPATFPVKVCDATVPAGARRARLGGRVVPLMAAAPRRIVVIGDTGCRLKARRSRRADLVGGGHDQPSAARL